MIVFCEHCNEKIILRKEIDLKKYDGEVYCQKCNSVWHIKITNSKIQGYKFVRYRKLQELSPEEISQFAREVKPYLDNIREAERKLMESSKLNR